MLHVIVDPQNDFCHEDGVFSTSAKPVLDAIVAQKNKEGVTSVATRDWHPANHISFVSTWPVHCVQNTWGAELHDAVKGVMEFDKGMCEMTEEYSGINAVNRQTRKSLRQFVEDFSPSEIVVSGFVMEFCVKATFDDLKSAFPTTKISLLDGGVHCLQQ